MYHFVIRSDYKFTSVGYTDKMELYRDTVEIYSTSCSVFPDTEELPVIEPGNYSLEKTGGLGLAFAINGGDFVGTCNFNPLWKSKKMNGCLLHIGRINPAEVGRRYSRGCISVNPDNRMDYFRHIHDIEACKLQIIHGI